MDRITEKQLQNMCDRLNGLTNSPEKPYVDGVAQIGNYHISHAYGGVCLHRMHNAKGGVTEPLYCGHCPTRELYYRIYSFIQGIESQRGAIMAIDSRIGGDVWASFAKSNGFWKQTPN